MNESRQLGRHAAGKTAVVLLSGGLDSSTALALASEDGFLLEAIFVDYGQAAAGREKRASLALAKHYGAAHRVLTLPLGPFGPGEVKGRNALLLHALLPLFESAVVVLAIHAGTPYKDCSPEFVELMNESYEFHSGGQLVLATPFLLSSKAEVYQLALSLKMPVGLTYSCESGDEPCHHCLSCRDREALLART